jgi:Arm DNA-binding domain
MALTDTTLRTVKAQIKPQKLSDGGGLHILVQPSGSKLWRLSYRFDGKQKTLALGSYPAISLAEARNLRDHAKKLLARSVDPSAQRKIERQIGKDSSFKAVAQELIAKQEREGLATVTLSKKRWLLEFAYPAFGDRPVADILAPDLLSLLRKIEGQGHYETAKRLRSFCGMVFRYAIATGRAQRDPSGDLRGAFGSKALLMSCLLLCFLSRSFRLNRSGIISETTSVSACLYGRVGLFHGSEMLTNIRLP